MEIRFFHTSDVAACRSRFLLAIDFSSSIVYVEGRRRLYNLSSFKKLFFFQVESLTIVMSEPKHIIIQRANI